MIERADNVLEDAARAFVRSRSQSDRERLCELSLSLVRRLASGVLRRLPQHFTDDDLIGDGCVGLLRAVDRYDPQRGLSFERWAARIVRGAMLNGLRRMDVVPERVRRDARNLDLARWRMAQLAGCAPSDAVAATGAGLSRRKLDAVLLALRRAVPISLDAPVQHATYSGRDTLGDCVPDVSADPARTVSDASVRAAVARAVTELSDRERTIIAWFYTGETTFRAIGGRLGISKQRVSQIHATALASLRTILAHTLTDA
jgi:RNA polymerase sigma factor FliA